MVFCSLCIVEYVLIDIVVFLLINLRLISRSMNFFSSVLNRILISKECVVLLFWKILKVIV